MRQIVIANPESVSMQPSGNFDVKTVDPNDLKAYQRLQAAPLKSFRVQYKSLNMRDYGEVNTVKVNAEAEASVTSVLLKALKAQGIYNVQILKITPV